MADLDDFNRVLRDGFPFYVRMGRDLVITDASPLLQRLAPAARVGRQLGEVITVSRPLGTQLTAESVAGMDGRFIVARVDSGLEFQGGLVPLSNGFLLIVTPRLISVQPLVNAGIHLSDLPPFDATGDLLPLLAMWEQQAAVLAQANAAHRAKSDDLKVSNQELARSTERLQLINGELEHRDRTRAEFFGFMNHELRTPIQAIVGLSTVLASRCLPGENGRLVTSLARSATHLHRMLDQLTVLTRISQGVFESTRVELDPRTILDECRDLLDQALSGKAVKVCTSVSALVPHTVLVDGTRLRQVVFNLATNAAKYTQRGEISVEMTAGRETGPDWMLCLTVSDTGIGVPEDERQRIFERGFRASNSENAQGHGFGLYISSEIARRLGGSLCYESRRRAGSRFTLRIPVSVPASPVGSPSLVEGVLPRHYTRVLRLLVVEDFEPIQDFIAASLATSGMAVTVAGSGRAALAAMHETRFDLILLDLNLPDGDGLRAFAEIRQWQATIPEEPTPVVALTGLSDDATRRRCLEAGLAEVVIKPATAADLRAVVHRHVGDRPQVLIGCSREASLARVTAQVPASVDAAAVATRLAFHSLLVRRSWDVVVVDPERGHLSAEDFSNLIALASGARVIAAAAAIPAGFHDPKLAVVNDWDDLGTALTAALECRPVTVSPLTRVVAAGESDISDLVQDYVDDVATSLRDCETALESGDHAVLRHVAHNIKGTAKTFGLPALETPARNLEGLAAAGASRDDLAASLRELTARFNELARTKPGALAQA